MPILRDARGAKVRLAYCTNVHSGETLDAIEASLDRHAAAVRERAGLGGRQLGVGLWLAAPVARALAAEPALAARLRSRLSERGLLCFTLNAFPYGGFHAARVKEAVYRPSWLEPARGGFTLDAARALAALLPEGEELGTISTLPLGWRADIEAEAALDAAAARLMEVAAGLARLRRETGRRIRLLIEPEPGCAIETTAEAIAFFERLERAGAAEGREHLGLCFDCCHQAVMGEELGASLARLDRAGVPVGKVHLSCAVEGPLARLLPLAEPRWLHQVVTADGRRANDLDDLGPLASAAALRARVHYHVPIYAKALASGLFTTRAALESALGEIVSWPSVPDLEIETYTWEALPAADRPPELAEGIAREVRWVLDRLAERGIA
jgi:sugar phosphate isomerase/epimerase